MRFVSVLRLSPALMVTTVRTPLRIRRLSSATNLVLVVGFLAAPAMAMAATPLKLDLTATVDERKVLVVGVTNLPDGTNLLVSVRRKESRFYADDKTKVSDGKFRAGPFSDKKEPLSPGRYMVEVMAPLAAVQPRPVQTTLGKDYSNFTGPLVRKEKYGTIIRRETSVIVAGVVDKKADANVNKARLEQGQKEGWEYRRKNCMTTPDMAARLTGQYLSSQHRQRLIDECLAEVEADRKKELQQRH
jgi:hypothetical protein